MVLSLGSHRSPIIRREQVFINTCRTLEDSDALHLDLFMLIRCYLLIDKARLLCLVLLLCEILRHHQMDGLRNIILV